MFPDIEDWRDQQHTWSRCRKPLTGLTPVANARRVVPAPAIAGAVARSATALDVSFGKFIFLREHWHIAVVPF